MNSVLSAAVLALPALVLVGAGLSQQADVARRSFATTGEVVAVEEVDPGKGAMRYRPVFRFEAPDVRGMTRAALASSRRDNDLAPGTRQDLLLDPDDPQSVWLAGDGWSRRSGWLMVAAGLIYAALLGYVARKALRPAGQRDGPDGSCDGS